MNRKKSDAERDAAIEEVTADCIADNKSGAFDDEFMMGIARAKAMTHEERLAQRPDILAIIDDAREHPEKLIRGRRRPDGL